MPLPKVTILVPGYLTSQNFGRTCSTISLVIDGALKIIVDPGTVASQSVLVESLRQQGLALDDINIVFITHAHTDHYKSCGLFPRAKILDFWGWWEGDKWTKRDDRVSKHIQLIKTPGHSYDSMTMLVQTEQGAVALCGDVFLTKDIKQKDPYAQDQKALKKSRAKVLKLADWIVPGHGEMFQAIKE